LGIDFLTKMVPDDSYLSLDKLKIMASKNKKIKFKKEKISKIDG
jgi:hypothetical protein